MLGILTAAILGVLWGSTVHAHSPAHALQQAHRSHAVSAQVVSAPVAEVVTSEVAQARWTGAGGKIRHVAADVPADAQEGGHLQIRLDAADKPVPAPASVDETTSDAGSPPCSP